MKVFASVKVMFVMSLMGMVMLACNPNDSDTQMFDFDLVDEFAIQGDSATQVISRAYLDTEYQWTSVHVNLNDGVIGDSLVEGCSNWSYEVNPKSTVEIWFPDAFVEDGIYHFSNEAANNDFQILVRRDLEFGPTIVNGIQYTQNSIQNQSTVARGFASFQGEPFDVTQASIQIENIRSQESSIRFVMELESGDCLRGSFDGIFEPFRRIIIDGDCD